MGAFQGFAINTYFRVGLRVLQKPKQCLRALLRPATLAVRRTFVLRLRRAPNTTAEATENDASLHRDDILQVLLRSLELHALEHHARFAHVLERDAKVRRAGLGRLFRISGFSRVLDHL